jgi:hypothetical protein
MLKKRNKNSFLFDNNDLLQEDDGKKNPAQKIQEIDNKINKFLENQFADDDDNFDKPENDREDDKVEILNKK